MRPLVDPGLLSRLERLQLATRRPLAGRFTGEHRSSRHGSSLDFADYREYHPGDDFRRIDYHLYARLDVLALKLFEAEDDLTVRLVIDTSASMASGGKLDYAARVAAAIGFVALVRRDAVTVHAFPLDRPSPRFNGRGATSALFDHLAALEAGGETPFADAVTDLLARRGPAGLTVVLSDLLTPEWATGISRLPARGADIAIIHLLDPGELDPDLLGDLELVDRESGDRIAVSLSVDALETYRRDARAWTDDVAARARRAGAAYSLVTTDLPLDAVLLGDLRARGVLT